MEKAEKKIFAPFRVSSILLLLLMTGFQIGYTQTSITGLLGAAGGEELPVDHRLYKVPFTGNYYDVIVPTAYDGTNLYLQATGADGGTKKNQNGKTISKGGSGAMVEAVFKVGNGTGEIPVGSTLRFMTGGKGDSKSTVWVAGTGGGGGTGIAYKDGNTGEWHLLMVAGGGSGASGTCCNAEAHGHSGKKYVNGSSGDGSGGASNGNGGGGGGAFGNSDYDDTNATNNDKKHAAAGWSNGPDAGEPTGGACHDDGSILGGWGFGAGGDGTMNNDLCGGGGGYTGGKYGQNGHDPAGGTSYVNENLEVSRIKSEEYGKTSSPEDGNIKFQFYNDPHIHITGMEFVNGDATNPMPHISIQGNWDGTLFCRGIGPAPIYTEASQGISLLSFPGVYKLEFFSTDAPAAYYHDSYTALIQQDRSNFFVFKPEVANPSGAGQTGTVDIRAYATRDLTYTLYKIGLGKTKLKTISTSVDNEEVKDYDLSIQGLEPGMYELEARFKDENDSDLSNYVASMPFIVIVDQQ